MGIKHSKILKERTKSKDKITVTNFTHLWPVFARAKPLICKPETVLDMPQGPTLTTAQCEFKCDDKSDVRIMHFRSANDRLE